MGIQDTLYKAERRLRGAIGLPPRHPTGSDYRIPPEQAGALSQGAQGLAETFYSHTGRTVHKWTHYLEIYERYFAPYRSTPVNFLEIGVFKGGSLELWRRYFGSDATITGLDVNPECADYVDPPNRVMIGSQDDPAFLKRVVAEIGTPDIILDDGSHVGRHQRASFQALFPLLKDGGLYCIEDIHTAYWPGRHEGGYRRSGTAIEDIKQMIDDMHAWYHRKPDQTGAKTEVGAIHVYDSIVIIEKRRRGRPGHIKVSE